MCRILLGNFLPFHGSPKSREGVGSRTMKTISSCPADSVQPPTDYGSSDCKPKSERWISQRCSARPRSIDLLNGHPYVLPPVCVLFSSSWEKWLPHAITQCQMLCLLSPLSSDYSLANKKYRTPKKSPSKPQKRFFPCVYTDCIYKSVLATFGYWRRSNPRFHHFLYVARVVKIFRSLWCLALVVLPKTSRPS